MMKNEIDSLKNKLYELQKIKGAFNNHFNGVFDNSLSFAGMSVLCVLLSLVFRFAGKSMTFTFGAFVALLVTCLIGNTAYTLSKKLKKNIDIADEKLASYDPVDKAAFELFQQSVKSFGSYDKKPSLEWVLTEETAIKSAIAKLNNTALSNKFISRDI